MRMKTDCKFVGNTRKSTALRNRKSSSTTPPKSRIEPPSVFPPPPRFFTPYHTNQPSPLLYACRARTCSTCLQSYPPSFQASNTHRALCKLARQTRSKTQKSAQHISPYKGVASAYDIEKDSTLIHHTPQLQRFQRETTVLVHHPHIRQQKGPWKMFGAHDPGYRRSRTRDSVQRAQSWVWLRPPAHTYG